jgi:hypothetical protein
MVVVKLILEESQNVEEKTPRRRNDASYGRRTHEVFPR